MILMLINYVFGLNYVFSAWYSSAGYRPLQQSFRYQAEVWTQLLIHSIHSILEFFVFFFILQINTEDYETMKEPVWNDVINKKW